MKLICLNCDSDGMVVERWCRCGSCYERCNICNGERKVSFTWRRFKDVMLYIIKDKVRDIKWWVQWNCYKKWKAKSEHRLRKQFDEIIGRRMEDVRRRLHYPSFFKLRKKIDSHIHVTYYYSNDKDRLLLRHLIDTNEIDLFIDKHWWGLVYINDKKITNVLKSFIEITYEQFQLLNLYGTTNMQL